MSKMHCFSKFSKNAKRWGLSAPSAHFCDLKLRDLPKFMVFQTDYVSLKISVMTSLLRHLKTLPKYRYRIFAFWALPIQNFWLRQYSIVAKSNFKYTSLNCLATSLIQPLNHWCTADHISLKWRKTAFLLLTCLWDIQSQGLLKKIESERIKVFALYIFMYKP